MSQRLTKTSAVIQRSVVAIDPVPFLEALGLRSCFVKQLGSLESKIFTKSPHRLARSHAEEVGGPAL